MKIAFWNGVNFTASQANYVAMVGILLARICKCNVVMSSNHISSHMLQDCFSDKMPEQGTIREPYRLYYSVPEYHRRLWELKRFRQSSIQEVPMDGITIVYPPDVGENIFYFETSKQTYYLVDIAGENYVSSQRALEEAEFIVLFLPPDEKEIRVFFQFISMIDSRFIIVIEGQIKMSSSFLQYLELNYGIKKKDIIIIPENSEFNKACNRGRLDYFVRDNIRKQTNDSNLRFWNAMRRITKEVYLAGVENNQGGAV